MATRAMAWAINRSSCARQAMWATPKKKMIGSSAAAPRPIMRAMGERPGPSAALMSERYANDSERQPTIQAQENAVATK